MKNDDSTLFRPDPKIGAFSPAMGRQGGGGGGGGGGADSDEPEVGVSDRIAEALRSAKRRKVLTAFVLFIGSIFTSAGAMLAPKTYGAEADILVQRSALTTNAGFGASPDEVKQIAKEYEQQILANDNIISIVQKTQLVNRWDEMRPPHRKLLDRVNGQVGRQAPTTDEKLDQLVKTLQAKLKVIVDGTTVSIAVDWSEPKASRDIVDVATKNFIDTRYQSEVGVLPESVRIAEQAVKRAREEFEEAFKNLEERQRLNTKVPGAGGGNIMPRIFVVDDAGRQGDVTIRAKLEQVRKDVAEKEALKRARIDELRQKKRQMESTMAPGHPEMISLNQLIAATEADTDELDRLRAQERSLAAQYEASKPPEAPKQPQPGPAPVHTAAPAPVQTHVPKSAEDVMARFEAAKAKYAQAQIELEERKKDLSKAEAIFKQRYRVTHPAEVPAAPKKPTHVIAFLVGVLLTILASLAAAVLRDRSVGIFYEPRDVRDRLRLPVFAKMKRM